MTEQTTTPDPAAAGRWLLSCIQCGGGWFGMDQFGTPEDRQQWADVHEAATGHWEFRYRDLPAAPDPAPERRMEDRWALDDIAEMVGFRRDEHPADVVRAVRAELARVRPVVDAARSLTGAWDANKDGSQYARALRAAVAALDGGAAATPQPAAVTEDRRALDSIAELCGARAGDHRDNVVMVVRSMLRDEAQAELVRVRPVVDAARAWKAKRDGLGWPRPRRAPAPEESSITEAADLHDAVAALDGDAAAPIPSCRGRGCGRDGCPSCDGTRAWYARLDGDAAARPQPAASAEAPPDVVGDLRAALAQRERELKTALEVIRVGQRVEYGLVQKIVAAEAATPPAARCDSDEVGECSCGAAGGSVPPADIPARLREAAAAVERVRDDMTTHPGAYRQVIDALTLLGRWLAADPDDPAGQAVARALAGPTGHAEETP